MSRAANVAPPKVPYFKLEIKKAFDALTPKEKLYTHHFGRASWYGASIVAEQISPESPKILSFLSKLFAQCGGYEALQTAATGSGKVSPDDYGQFGDYCALFLANMGNYLSFGDSKFVPACSQDTFRAIVQAAPQTDTAPLLAELEPLLDKMYSLEENELSLAFPPKGITNYYGGGITQAEAELVEEFLVAQCVSQYNTRVFKVADKHFSVHVACANARTTTHEYNGNRIDFEFGEYAPQMVRIVAHLRQARDHCANEVQRETITRYIDHFEEGLVDYHKEAQRAWVKDKGPAVETNIGFIESYRDPLGVRGEFEGIVAVVNKEQSKKYSALVAGAEALIARLPWGQDFEKDTFLSPDFTSLDVFANCGSGLAIGICLPNYDDIRQDHGFKNVYLSNVVSAINMADKMPHLTDADWELYKEHFVVAMEVNVGIHELLGHGTGKLLAEKADGTRNFDPSLVNPLTGAPVATWYKPGETWSGVFGGISNPFEECRAEAVALYLSLEPEAQLIFEQDTPAKQHNTIHIVWLNMIRAGLVGMEFYTPEQKQWRQAHMQARFAILQTLLRAPNSIVTIETEPELVIRIDDKRIATDGKAAIHELLRNLNIAKATADVKRGTEYFEGLTAVDDKFLALREIVMASKKPRKQYVQPHTRLDGDTVELVEFDGSPAGIVASFVARYNDLRV